MSYTRVKGRSGKFVGTDQVYADGNGHLFRETEHGPEYLYEVCYDDQCKFVWEFNPRLAFFKASVDAIITALAVGLGAVFGAAIIGCVVGGGGGTLIPGCVAGAITGASVALVGVVITIAITIHAARTDAYEQFRHMRDVGKPHDSYRR